MDHSSAHLQGLEGVAEDESERLSSRREALVRAKRSSPLARSRAQQVTATSGQRNLAFLGKSKCDPDERELLALFGRLLHDSGVSLHTSTASNDSNDAINAGYKAAGGVCQRHAKHLDKTAPTLVLYTDKILEDKLDSSIPDWRDKGWLILSTQEKLIRVCEAAMMFLEEEE